MAEREDVPIADRSIVTEMTAPIEEMLRIKALPEAEQQPALVALEKWLLGQFEVLKGMTQEGAWFMTSAWSGPPTYGIPSRTLLLNPKIGEPPVFFDRVGPNLDMIVALFLRKGYVPHSAVAEFGINLDDGSLAKFSLCDMAQPSALTRVDYNGRDGFTLTKSEPKITRFPIIRS